MPVDAEKEPLVFNLAVCFLLPTDFGFEFLYLSVTVSFWFAYLFLFLFLSLCLYSSTNSGMSFFCDCDADDVYSYCAYYKCYCNWVLMQLLFTLVVA